MRSVQTKCSALRPAKQFSAPLFLLILFAALTGARGQTQNPKTKEADDDVVRISTTLVTVTVNVKDHHGKVVPDLAQKDFQIYEDGVEQEIVYFASPKQVTQTVSESRLPFTVALLLDVSDSTKFKLDQIKQAATAFIDELQNDDRVLVVAFDKNVRVLVEATNDRKALREAINRTRTGAGTSLYSAIDLVITHRLNGISGPKAIVLFTDGVDTASVGATFDGTVSAAETSDATIYPIQYNTYADFADSPSRQTFAVGGLTPIAHATRNGEMASEAYKRATNYLRLLAEKTGGDMQYSDSVKYLSRSFTRIATRLRQQYVLGYYPKNRAASRRQINVRVGLRSAVVNARKSYYYNTRH